MCLGNWGFGDSGIRGFEYLGIRRFGDFRIWRLGELAILRILRILRFLDL
jgi:hypothetical protein